LLNRGEAVVKFKRGALAPCWETVFKFRNMLENSVIMVEKLSMLEECWKKKYFYLSLQIDLVPSVFCSRLALDGHTAPQHFYVCVYCQSDNLKAIKYTEAKLWGTTRYCLINRLLTFGYIWMNIGLSNISKS
jgi:hypothetical protein